MSDPIHVGVARFLIKPQWTREFAANVTAGVASVRSNPDNYQFEFYAYASDPLRFFMYQTFASDAAFEAHRTFPPRLANFQTSLSRMEGPPTRSLWRPFDGKRPVAPDAAISSASVVIARAKTGERARLAELLAGAFSNRPGGVLVNVSYDASDPDRLMVFARWSGQPNVDERDLERVAVFAGEAPEHLTLLVMAGASMK
jgi:quinol monooxygenase YgiN